MKDPSNKFQLNLLLQLFAFVFWASAQEATMVESKNGDISDNLDLEAVASVFGTSIDVEDFEKRLNNPKTQISNLDLNSDDLVDYLRIMEFTNGNFHTLSIQSIFDKDQYQEVASIIVELDTLDQTRVQIIGDANIYGTDYHITPVYENTPAFLNLMYLSSYLDWQSKSNWGHYPPDFQPWHPHPYYIYKANVHAHINVYNSYDRTNSGLLNKNQMSNTVNNAYFIKRPEESFDKRNPGVANRNELIYKNNLTRNKKKNKSTFTAQNKTNKSRSKTSTSKPSSKLSKNQRAKPNSLPLHNLYATPEPSEPINSYSRQAPARTSVTRTRH